MQAGLLYVRIFRSGPALPETDRVSRPGFRRGYPAVYGPDSPLQLPAGFHRLWDELQEDRQ